MRSRHLLLGTAIVLFLTFCLLPPLLLLVSAFVGPDGPTLARLQDLLLDGRQLGLLWNSLRVGLGTVVVSTLIGVPAAYLLSRTDLPGKGTFTVLTIAPIIVPPYVMGIAYTELLSDLRRQWGDGVPVLGGIDGSIYLLSCALFPLVVLLASKGFRSVDGAAEQAARLARGPVPAFFGVTLRMATPSIIAGALFVFVFAFSDFSIPDYLSFAGPPDQNSQVFATEVYSRFSTQRSAEDAAMASVPLVALVLVAVLLLLRLEGRGDYVLGGGQLRITPDERRLGRWRPLAVLYMVLLAIFTAVAPLTQLARWAFRDGPNGRLHGFQSALSEAGPDIGRSLLLSAGAGLIMAILGFLLAYAIVRARSRAASRRLAALALLPIAFPAVMLAIGQIRFWNRPWDWQPYLWLSDAMYSGSLLVLVTYIARFLPFAVLTLRSALRSVDPELEQASSLAGRGFPVTLLRVTAPAVARGLATAALVGFLLCMRELDTVTLIPGGSDTLPHRVYSMVHTSRDSIIAALCLVLVVASALPLLIYRLLVGRKIEVL